MTASGGSAVVVKAGTTRPGPRRRGGRWRHRRFLACFIRDALVDDWGQEFRGPDAIRGWSQGEFIGAQVFLAVVDVTSDDAVVTVIAEVGGSAFNGLSRFAFTVDCDWVAIMAIRA